MKKYLSFLAANRLKNTAARRVLFETALSQKGHFSVEEFFSAAQQKEHSIGLATVYRFLGVLTKSGILAERHFGEKTLFELEKPNEHHDHLVCEHCGRVVEFVSSEIEDEQDIVAEKNNFVLTDHRHELYGVCGECQKKNMQKKTEDYSFENKKL